MLKITWRRSFLLLLRVISPLLNNLLEISVMDTFDKISEAIAVAVWLPLVSISRTSTQRGLRPCSIILIAFILFA